MTTKKQSFFSLAGTYLEQILNQCEKISKNRLHLLPKNMQQNIL